jgi:hypothetical protein
MLIVDAQVHIWGADTPERPWPASGRSRPHRPQPFSKDDLLRDMDAAGVARVVIVPPSWEGDRNDLALEGGAAAPRPFRGDGRRRPPAEGTCSELARAAGHAGIRVTSARRAGCSRAGKRLAVGAAGGSSPTSRNGRSRPLPELGRLAERYSGLRLVIDHLALVRNAKDEAAFGDLPQLLALAKYPNVAAKTSALPRASSEAYPYPKLHPYLCQVFDAFGPRRMFWGTDLTGIPCTYRQAIAMFTEELPWLRGDDLEWVMGRGICEWLGWPLPS